MLCKPLFLCLKVAFCLQAFLQLFTNPANAQSITPFITSTKLDYMVDVSQINDSMIIGFLYNPPVELSTSFLSSPDSIISHVYILNINTKESKTFPIKGNADSIEIVLPFSPFLLDNILHFLTYKIARNNPPTGSYWEISPHSGNRHLYRFENDTIMEISSLSINLNRREINPHTFANVTGNIVTVYGDSSNSIYNFRLAEFSPTGILINNSSYFFSPYLSAVIQNPQDSTYSIYSKNPFVVKLDKNMQLISSNSPIKEQNTGRTMEVPYFKSEVSADPIISGILWSNAIGDSNCIVATNFINDSTFSCLWKKLVNYELITPNYNNYVYNSYFNSSNFEDHFYYAYDKKQCLFGNAGCLSKFVVIKHDTLNNTIWEIEFGGDAGYIVGKALALTDSSCIVFVMRTDNFGNTDVYYVHITKDGNVTTDFLPILGKEKLSIPFKENMTLYPNPASETIYLDNLTISKIAKEIYIIDISGKVHLSQHFEKSIDISSLPIGHYIYRVSTVNGSYHETRFVKN